MRAILSWFSGSGRKKSYDSGGLVTWSVLFGVAIVVGGLLWTNNLFVLVSIVGVAVAIVLGLNRGFPYLVIFAVASVATGVTLGSFAVGDFFAIGAAFFGLLGRIVHHERIPLSWLYIPPIGILLWGFIANLMTGYGILGSLGVFVGAIIVVIAAISLPIRREEQLTFLMKAFVVGAVVNACIAIADYLLPGFSTSTLTGFGGHRPPGLTMHSNQLGLICDLALPFVYYLATRRRAWLIASIFLFGGVLVSGSRGALIGIGIATVLYIIVARQRAFRKLTLAAVWVIFAMYVAQAAGFGVGITRLFGNASASGSDLARIQLMDFALDDFLGHPFTGVGYTSAKAHNFYLEILRSGGIPALVLMLIFVVGLLAVGWKMRKSLPAAIPAVASASTWFVLAVQDNAFAVRVLWFPAGIIIACAALSRSEAFGGRILARPVAVSYWQRRQPHVIGNHSKGS